MAARVLLRAGRGQMRQRLVGLMITAATCLVGGAAPVSAQAIGPDPLLAARDEVVADLIRSLPATLAGGALAILPPHVVKREAVDGSVVQTWATALVEQVHRQRPQVTLTDRDHLTDVLREQKFGDSAYADSATAAKVGKLVAARTLLLTRLHEFRLQGGRVRVAVEASLVDVETSQNLWSRAYHRGIFPFWAKVLIGLVIAVVGLVAVLSWMRHRKTALVKEELPRGKAEARVDLDGLARSVTDARERFNRAGLKDSAASLQRAWVDLDAVLDRARHALPGGSVDRSRIRDLTGALREAGAMSDAISDLRRACDRSEITPAVGEELARRLERGALELRGAIDAFRKHMI